MSGERKKEFDVLAIGRSAKQKHIKAAMRDFKAGTGRDHSKIHVCVSLNDKAVTTIMFAPGEFSCPACGMLLVAECNQGSYAGGE